MTRSMDLQRKQLCIMRENRVQQGWLPWVRICEHMQTCEVAYRNPEAPQRQDVRIEVFVVGPAGDSCNSHANNVCLYKIVLLEGVMDFNCDFTQKLLKRAQTMAGVIAKALNSEGIKPKPWWDSDNEVIL